MRNIIIPLFDFIKGGNTMPELNRLKDLANSSRDQILIQQERKLKDLLDFVTKESPYYSRYRDRFISHKNPFSALSEIDILEKKTIRERPQEIATTKLNHLVPCFTSGSSGVQTKVFVNQKELSNSRAYQLLWWSWAAYEIGDSTFQTGIQFSRSLLKALKDKLLRVKYILAFSHDPQSLPKIFKPAIDSKKEFFLAGYASSLYSISKSLEKEGIGFKNFKGIVTWGDKLFPYYREKIEKVFSQKIHETYGTSEELMIAAQHDLDMLYIMDDHVFIEIVDDQGNQVPDGEMGNILVTCLDHYSFPLIRYRIGDLAIKLPEVNRPIHAKLPFSILEKIIGRDTDIVKTSWGESLVVHSFTGIFPYYPEIIQFQVIQDTIDQIRIRVIVKENYNQRIEDEVKEKINSELRNPLKITVEKVDEIPRSPSGKPQIIVSNLPR